jgi:Ca2+-binding EF-hand superfamily protein
MDKDRNGTIDFKEFADFMQNISSILGELPAT